jgi:hypothetical protein
MFRFLHLAAAVMIAAAGLTACQPAAPPTPAMAPQQVTAPAQADGPTEDSAEMPPNWQIADGPGATAIFVEDQGQRIALECGAKDSQAAGAPGKLVASATWRPDETPPKAEDVALIVQGAGFRAAPIWARENGRDRVSIQLDPSPEVLQALERPGGLRVIAGDWFLAVAEDPAGAPKAFARACARLVQ